jgi:hypothetical protein
MQTFVPYPDFQLCVKLMDYRRLGKQRVEVLQLLKALNGETKGWSSHPAALMWSKNIDALKAYGNECINEWVARGYKNTMPLWEVPEDYDMPWWWGWDVVHKSHRDNLFRKDSDHYSCFADADPNGPYIWPHKIENQYHIGNETLVRMRHVP